MLGVGGPVGLLGELPFVCAFGRALTFHKLSREQKVRWARHEVIGKKPVLEWVGEELTTVSMAIRFDTNLGVPPQLGMMQLQRMLKSREPHILIIGPDYMGKFVLEGISEEQKYFTGMGVCQVSEVVLTLTEFDDPNALSLLDAATDAVSGLKDKVTGAIDGVVGGISDKIGGVVDGIKDGVGGIADGVTGGIKDKINGVFK